jgi:hypothetical protein
MKGIKEWNDGHARARCIKRRALDLIQSSGFQYFDEASGRRK